ncbi:MAG: ABA4-like family protein [Pseudomonadota bacterium]
MTPGDYFSFAGAAAMTGWVILILGPRRFWWLNAVPLWIIPCLISALYAVLVLRWLSSAEGGFDSLETVASLFENEWALLAGWIHFLAFDLFVGAVMALRMDRVGVGRLVQAPILAATLMLGPLGFLIAALTELGLRLRYLPLQTPNLRGVNHGNA